MRGERGEREKGGEGRKRGAGERERQGDEGERVCYQ